MIRIRPSSLSQSTGRSTLFLQLGSPALQKVSSAGAAGQSYVSLSGLLHVCAYMYETGAILGRARQDRLSELLTMSFAEEMEHCVAELRHLLRRRLEQSGRYAHSFYTFYLHGTMRDMNMNFYIKSMKEANHNIRNQIEAGHFLEYAGAEGLLMGGWYPELAEKMYGKGYGAQEDIINEMTRGAALLPEEIATASIQEREQVILNSVNALISQYFPEFVDNSKVIRNETPGLQREQSMEEEGQLIEAYLDIKTTGLAHAGCGITVIGIHICNNGDSSFTQLVGKDISGRSVLEALQGVNVLYTYNGSRFDLPFIHRSLGINLAKDFTHIDLMYHCWRKNLYGGLKNVERQLGIERRLVGINGYEAVKLWWRYVDSFDLDALNTLLEYNKEDVVNLKTLKDRLI